MGSVSLGWVDGWTDGRSHPQHPTPRVSRLLMRRVNHCQGLGLPLARWHRGVAPCPPHPAGATPLSMAALVGGAVACAGPPRRGGGQPGTPPPSPLRCPIPRATPGSAAGGGS